MITTLGRHRGDRVVAGADLHSDQPTILISYLGRRRPLISWGRDDPEVRPANAERPRAVDLPPRALDASRADRCRADDRRTPHRPAEDAERMGTMDHPGHWRLRVRDLVPSRFLGRMWPDGWQSVAGYSPWRPLAGPSPGPSRTAGGTGAGLRHPAPTRDRPERFGNRRGVSSESGSS